CPKEDCHDTIHRLSRRRRRVARARERRFGGRHLADRDDRGRHPLHRGPDGQRLRGLPLRRLSDLRAAHQLGPLAERQAPVPGLAESWEVSKSDPKKWIFKLRRNVKFHDGSAFNADAVLFTFDSIKNKQAAQFDQYGSAQISWRLSALKAMKKLDDYTIELE